MIDLTDPDYDGPWTGDQGPELHPAVRGMLAVRYVDRNGRVKMPTFVGPDATENAWHEFERRDAHALESDRERPRIMRWNGATWQLHHQGPALTCDDCSPRHACNLEDPDSIQCNEGTCGRCDDACGVPRSV